MDRRIGRRVRIKIDENFLRGTIVDLNTGYVLDLFKIRLDNGTTVDASERMIEFLDEDQKSHIVSHCDCGLKFVREGGKHSDWCLAYKKEV